MGLAVALFVGMMICLEIGFRLGRRSAAQGDAREGVGAIEAAVFALLGLLLGFSFAGAASRLDSRRELIVREANAIGTAYLRLDTLAPADQPGARRLFGDYLDARLGAYNKLPDVGAMGKQLERATQIQHEIWSRAVAASRADSTNTVTRLLLPALNEMIDVTTSRAVAFDTRLPALILFLLLGTALLSGLLAGLAMTRRKSLLHMLVYAFVVSVTIYTVVDLDNPRSGLIRLDAADNALIKLRDSIR